MIEFAYVRSNTGESYMCKTYLTDLKLSDVVIVKTNEEFKRAYFQEYVKYNIVGMDSMSFIVAKCDDKWVCSENSDIYLRKYSGYCNHCSTIVESILIADKSINQHIICPTCRSEIYLYPKDK